MPPQRRRPSRIPIVICIILAVILAASASLNIALLVSPKSGKKPVLNISGEVTTDTTDTELKDSSDNIPDSEQTTPSTQYTAEPDETTADPTESELSSLREMVDFYASAANSSFSAQAGSYNALLNLMKLDSRPTRTHLIPLDTAVPDDTDKSDEESSSDASEDTEEPEYLPITIPSNVAFAYLDLETGYTFSFNADEVMYSASLIKAPYIYSVFKAVEEFENNKLTLTSDGSALYDEDGNPLFEGKHPNLDENGKIIYGSGEEKFDLSREWVYDSKTMFVEGSGNIQTQEDGFTLTYLELAEYALKYSDNIALEALTREFGYGYYNTVASSLGISGVPYGFMQLSANDCIKFLKEIYAYMETDSPYAAVMKKAMTEAPYNVMIPAAVSPLQCAHKYGWDVDSYHDMGVVYHERPFALAVMTDLDEGRAQDYMYIQNIAKAVLDLHESFTPDLPDSTDRDGGM